MKIIPKEFYDRDSAQVAKDLLGKLIIRKLGDHRLVGKIVETEAYYGLKDPSSRAFTTPKMAAAMWGHPGQAFVYMVHNNWLFNVVTEKEGIPAAVLIRALEPVEGIELMKNHRGRDGFGLTNGPGKLTHALRIEKQHSSIKVYDPNSEIIIAEPSKKEKFQIASSNRVGVRYDLKRKLRFYLQKNKWVSKGKIYGEFISTGKLKN